MTFEMISSILIGSTHRWFSHVMEQHGKAEYLISLYILQGVQRMLSHIIFMVGSILFHPDHRIPLRQDHLCDPQLIRILDPFRMRGYKQFYKLCLYPLCADLFQRGRKLPDRIRSLCLYGEIKLR